MLHQLSHNWTNSAHWDTRIEFSTLFNVWIYFSLLYYLQFYLQQSFRFTGFFFNQWALHNQWDHRVKIFKKILDSDQFVKESQTDLWALLTNSLKRIDRAINSQTKHYGLQSSFTLHEQINMININIFPRVYQSKKKHQFLVFPWLWEALIHYLNNDIYLWGFKEML